MRLDEFAKIAAAEIAFYSPVALIAFFVAFKHGFGRRQGWVFLFTFSIVRIVGAILTLVYRTQSVPSIGLVIAATILTGIGLSPLLLATHGFVSKISSSASLVQAKRLLHIARILLLIAVVLGIVGGSSVNPTNSQSQINTGRILLRVTSIVFVAVFAILFWLHIRLWNVKDRLPDGHRKLLTGVSLALPFLLVRLIYSILGAFASSGVSRFSPVNGDWRIYLGMSLIMEYVAVIAYVTAGILAPIHKDEAVTVRGTPLEEQNLEMNPQFNQQYQPSFTYNRVPLSEPA